MPEGSPTGLPGIHLLRDLAPRVLAAVVRRYGHFDLAEDAVQEALIAAATRWERDGPPDNPGAWLVTVASRRLTDLLRAENARRRREQAVASWTLPSDRVAPAADEAEAPADDTLVLLVMCCHPALSPASQIALTLRAVGGLTTAEIARALLVPEATMVRRITRAKQSIKDSRLPFALPRPDERAQRFAAVLHVLYLIFNEGYVATSGPRLHRVELSAEAIRLARAVHRALPDDAEAAGLLALMLLTDARRAARTGPDGMLVPMAEQDRGRWNRPQIREGLALLDATLPRRSAGPYQVQAAIAALHDEAPSVDETDWPQILALYDVLLMLQDSPVVRLNRVVALAMTDGPPAGLAALSTLEAAGHLPHDHRPLAVRAHLLELAGDHTAAVSAYRAAADRSASLPQQRYLNARAARLSSRGDSVGDRCRPGDTGPDGEVT
jgi:RNA polymerase sigma factor (sigma-70 family)